MADRRDIKPRLGGPEMTTAQLFRLDGRTVLISGGAGDLGLAVAESVLETGGDVVCLDLRETPPAEPWARLESLAAQHGTQIAYHQADVTDADRISAVFAGLRRLRYPLRGVVACAGIGNSTSAVNFDVAKFRRTLDVNLTGTFLVAQAAAREMRRHGQSGSMVLVASMAGSVAMRGSDVADYESSKAATIGLGRSLAKEWSSQAGFPLIRVNTLSPGYIKTGMLNPMLRAFPDAEKNIADLNMMNRLSFADEYRAPAVFLLADGSGFMTGADLKVDGGHTAW
ncbi:short-chain dehydrogenase [Penicillium alfredii]|uniref:Short-chain dehydrogenase n=1 Tax=Penicillium alfredii TaxID=1506179 RepID=A0A9W9FT89_9EURO|nr:short-chain dehydrogenase [Penicillium alfredii]KAJ5105919.1 short-chain dehydrogenase [Penicillium alfredii]